MISSLVTRFGSLVKFLHEIILHRFNQCIDEKIILDDIPDGSEMQKFLDQRLVFFPAENYDRNIAVRCINFFRVSRPDMAVDSPSPR